MRYIGRLLQKIALAIPPLAILFQILPANALGQPVLSLGQMLIMVGAAVCLFLIGRIIEGYSRP